MIFTPERLYELLPAIYRIRDAEQGEPLRALLKVLSEQIGVLEENLAQLYDDQFAETCAPWVLPYLADLLGMEGLTATSGLSPRAEVAHTIGYRRRKGTATTLEQVARDVTGWPARAVEFFQLIAATQFMNHLRPETQSFVSLRNANRLGELGGPFERAPKFGDPDLTHTVDVRRIARGHGRYNIPNVGLFLWRLRAMALSRSPAVPATPGDKRNFLFSPLGFDMPLFNSPQSETLAAHLAEAVNVPGRIRRRVFAAAIDDYYGRSLLLELQPAGGGAIMTIQSSQLVVCDLSGWINLPTSAIAIDPVLGRIAFPHDQSDTPLVSFHYGFSANMGGGEYSRLSSVEGRDLPVEKVAGSAKIADALAALPSTGGTVEVGDSGRYTETLAIDATGRFIELRAGDKRRPTIVLNGELTVTGSSDDHVILDGLLLTGAGIRVSGTLGRLTLRHCTLVPVNVPNLIIESAHTAVEIDHCIVGGIRAVDTVEMKISGSIVDATSEKLLAYGGTAAAFGAPLHITNSTVIGQVQTTTMRLASNSIFLASIAAPVLVERRQEGCVRFSYLSPGAKTPRRYHCQPETEDSLIRPRFVSTSFQDPGYCQLSEFCPPEIREGADDEASMGAFHDLLEPQRESRLRVNLETYLRFGLEAGIFYVS